MADIDTNVSNRGGQTYPKEVGMAPDPSAFIVVPVEASMPVLWRAMRAIRSGLSITRVYWHPDERFRDGHHFRVEVPVAHIPDPVAATANIQSILLEQGAVLTY
jgi:hypothetical protein